VTLAAEVRDEPENEGKSGAQNETGDDGKVEGAVLAAMDDVAGEFAKAEGEFSAEVEKSADDRDEGTEEKKATAEIAKGIHTSIIEERCRAREQTEEFEIGSIRRLPRRLQRPRCCGGVWIEVRVRAWRVPSGPPERKRK
jgi:hypothetical protein